MGRIVIELTDRCNLRCRHCFSGRHGGRGWLDMATLENILEEAQALGYEELAYTGGEPTLHPAFPTFVAKTAAAGYRFGMVTNGWTFRRHYKRLAAHRPLMQGVTFSLDGASAETHDRLRGEGSFRRVLQAASLCVMSAIPFAFNMVVTRESRHEIATLVGLAGSLGSLGVRFGHFIPTGRQASEGLALDWQERVTVETIIKDLQAQASCAVALAPGHRTAELFPCGPLNDQEFNIDWRGNVGFCCHLSGQSDHLTEKTIIGNLKAQPVGRASGSPDRAPNPLSAGEAGAQGEEPARCSRRLALRLLSATLWRERWGVGVDRHAIGDQAIARRCLKAILPSRIGRVVMPDLNDHFQCNEEVILTELEGGEAVLLHLGTRKYYSLNETGVTIWQGLHEGLNLKAIVEALESVYEVDREHAIRSVTALVDELTAEKLIESVT